MAPTANTLDGIVINELGVWHGAPGALDINNDGVVDSFDNYIEIYNTSGSAVDVSGWEVWFVSNNAGAATQIDTIDAATTIGAAGHLTLTEPLPVGGDHSLIPGAVQEMDAGIGGNSQSTYALYDPVSNTYLLLKGGFEAGSQATMEAGLAAAHSGASNAAAGVDVYPVTTVTGPSMTRVTDGDSAWEYNDMTPGEANCFAEGTMISTQNGDVAVEMLEIGQMVQTDDGRDVAVKWVGHQTVVTRFGGQRAGMVCIKAGALGNHSDLLVTCDHGMILGGLVINASALVNGNSIDFVPLAKMPKRFTVYHVETEAHDVILANGAPSETYLDIPGRMAFDNYTEYLDLYGTERIIPEMNRPRISAQRLLPDAIKARLGITEGTLDWTQFA